MKIVLAVLVLMIGGIYLSTAPPTVYLGDSGEIISAAYTLGIGHPPGYPLYMLVTNIFMRLPLGDIAFRANLLAVFLGMLVFITLYYTILYFIRAAFDGAKGTGKGPQLASLFGACVYAFSSLFWFQSIHSKGGIYVITHLVVLISILFTLKFIYEKEKKYMYFAAYLAGLLPALHHSASLVTVFIVAALIYNSRPIKARGLAITLGLFLLSFITPYMYLIIRAKAAPVVCWADIRTSAQVFKHIIRYIYLSQPDVPASWATMSFKLDNYIRAYNENYGPLGLFFFAGMAVLFRKNRKIFLTLLAFIAMNLLALAFLTKNTMSPYIVYLNSSYYLIVDMAAVAAAAAAVYWLFRRAYKWKKSAAYLVVAVSLLLPSYLAVENYRFNDQSIKFLAYDNADNILKTLKSGDILFVNEDQNVFNILYLKYVKHKYENIRAYDRLANFLDTSIYSDFRGVDLKLVTKDYKYEGLDYDMAKQQMMQMLIKQVEVRIIGENPGRVYYTNLAAYPNMGFLSEPFGMLYRIYKKEDGRKDGLRLMSLYSIRDIFRNPRLDLFYRDVIARYFLAYAKYAAIRKDGKAFNIFKDHAELLAYDSGAVMNTISSIYLYDIEDHAKAIEYMEKVMAINPYEYGALNVLIKLCLDYDKIKAVRWLNHFYNVAPTRETQNNILIKLQELRENSRNPAPAMMGR